MSINDILAKGVAQFDGGFGSQLNALGITYDCPERLNLTHPEAVQSIHRAYVEAGAQVVETNTLGANPYRLAAHGLAAETARIVAQAVQHVRAAGAPVIACSMGTTAEFLQPVGTLSFDEAVDIFSVQAIAAAQSGADLLFTETLTDLAEARAMWIAAAKAKIPFGVSFTFMENGRTLTGSPAAVCALAAQAMGAVLVGVNCVGDPALLIRIIKEMRAFTHLPIVAQPNAGHPERINGVLHYGTTPEMLLPTMQEALACGAGAIGGCCGTTPAHIRRMAELSSAAKAPAPGWDSLRRICSLRSILTLDEALTSAAEMTPATLDDTDAPAVWIDLRGASPQAAMDAVDEAGLIIKQPILFRADDADTLAAALRHYPGIAAVDAPFVPGFGAVSVS